MSSRPRRSAAAKAKEVISVHARWADTSEKEDSDIKMSSRRTGRAGGASASRDTASSPEETHLSVTVKLPNSRSTRGGNRRADPFEGGEIVHGKRNRGGKKSYVIDSSPDDEEEEEEEEEVVVEDDDDDDEEEDDDDEEDTRADEDDEMEELGDEDAEGEDEMEVDAEGEEDADGDIDMAPKPVGRPSAKNSRITKSRPTVKVTSSRVNRDADEDEDEEDEDDDDELSDPADSDIGDDTIVYGNQDMEDEDAEGEEIEVAGDEEEVEEDDEIAMQQEANGDSELDSEEGSRAETPDLAKMTKRQRARFEDIPQEFMKLPDEIQVKKVFTAEELSMRRQEMARRRRNLSEKRNEEVKMETINKLLKKQAPKINRKAAAADAQDQDSQKANPVFIRWVSNKSGNRVAVPEEIIEGPAGAVFGDKGKSSLGKPVVEVA
ncbi:hypothetical protein CFAM422_011971 [Trichoderma lentiforme]|uniref:INO80 complex subunit B-like conserved region domain-containing protein n=1 Tax=Trichoderma lentiforme TaxID=1567552 RepID=A0A9P5C977_9HYPO|nr:hypothetical protein CFAM422_011971 [Trichoderma lentiforme]